MRQRVAPIQPNSPEQSAQRALLASAVAQYAALTGPQVLAWQLFAEQLTKTNRLGDTYTPSAIQTFVSYYIDQSLIGVSPPSVTPPVSTYQPEVSKIDNLLAEETAQVLTELSFDVIEATEITTTVLIQATPPHAPALQNASKLFRSIPGDPNAAWYSGVPLDITTDYLARFPGGVAAGDVIDLRVKLVQSGGLSSAWYYAKAVIATAVP